MVSGCAIGSSDRATNRRLQIHPRDGTVEQVLVAPFSSTCSISIGAGSNVNALPGFVPGRRRTGIAAYADVGGAGTAHSVDF